MGGETKVSVSDVQLSPSLVANASLGQRRQMLEQAVEEVVGSVFYTPMLKMARDNPLKGKYGHGGRGEEVFGAQLDMELARRASHRANGGLTEALLDRFDRKA